MTAGAAIIDGRALAKGYRERVARRVAELQGRGVEVRLDAVLVDSGDDAARQYARSQARTCGELGIRHVLHELRADSSEEDIAGRVLLLNTNDDVSAMMVHLPMPPGVDAAHVQGLIAPEKDVEGVNPVNIGNIVYGRSSLAPCTALATVKMIESVLPNETRDDPGALRGKRAVVVGAGDVVGKPIAVLLMRREATVISCNSATPDIAELTRGGDILVAAAGAPGLITKEMVKPGAIVIDVGVNRVPGPDGAMRTVGDVAFDEVRHVAGHISPVPGGVGPMTVAMLLVNVVQAAERGIAGR